MKKRPTLFFAGHGDGALGTDEGADSAAFAEIVIDLNVAGLLVSGDAKIRAKIAAQVAAAAEIIPKAPARLHDRCLLVKTRFDMVKFFGVLLFVPAPDFQFTWFSHPDFLRLTAESQRTQRKYFSELHSVQSGSPMDRKTLCALCVFAVNHFPLIPSTGPRPGRLSCRWPWLPPPCLAPVTKSPAANTPSTLACSVSRSIDRALLPDARPLSTGS